MTEEEHARARDALLAQVQAQLRKPGAAAKSSAQIAQEAMAELEKHHVHVTPETADLFVKNVLWNAILGLFLWIVTFPIVAFALGEVMSLIWKWYLSDVWGESPSTKAWFGIAMVVTFVVDRFQKIETEDVVSRPVRAVVTAQAGALVLIVLFLVIAAASRVVWGWT